MVEVGPAELSDPFLLRPALLALAMNSLPNHQRGSVPALATKKSITI
ncbi:MAG: hypothetical protein ACOYNY_24380 [Caldilineaceae bacterium]